MHNGKDKYHPIAQQPTYPPSEVPKLKGWMRNKPCLCGSGKKFKKCCMSKYYKIKNAKEKADALDKTSDV